nr:Unknown Function [uncultured bacterium]
MDVLNEWILSNFNLTMFMLAVVLILLHKSMVGRRLANEEIVYRWLVLFPLGLTNIYLFATQTFLYFYAVQNAFLTFSSVFQTCLAYLALGVIAISSFNASYGFRLATVTANVIFLFGCAAQSIYLLTLKGSYDLTQLGSLVWLNQIILPCLLILCMIGLSRKPRR